jgi:hypothetical protein
MYLFFYQSAVKKRGRRNRTSCVLESVHWEVCCGEQTQGQPTADSYAPFSWLFAQFLGEGKKKNLYVYDCNYRYGMSLLLSKRNTVWRVAPSQRFCIFPIRGLFSVSEIFRLIDPVPDPYHYRIFYIKFAGENVNFRPDFGKFDDIKKKYRYCMCTGTCKQ